MLVADPMHNRFLRSAKHILKKVWSANDVLDLSKKEPVNIYKVLWIACMQVPLNIGRISRKVETGFSGLMADHAVQKLGCSVHSALFIWNNQF